MVDVRHVGSAQTSGPTVGRDLDFAVCRDRYEVMKAQVPRRVTGTPSFPSRCAHGPTLRVAKGGASRILSGLAQAR